LSQKKTKGVINYLFEVKVSMKEIKIKLFANIREIVGEKLLVLSVTDAHNIKDLKSSLVDQYPRLKAIFHNVLFVVDGRIALDDFIPEDGAEITILPRIGGG